MYSSTGAVTRQGTTSGIAAEVAAIAVAIDQLAAEVRAHSSRREHTERVAEIWLMMASLDPELARCAERYARPGPVTPSVTATGPADGAILP